MEQSAPAVVGLGPEYVIVREIFLVQDSRPLCHFPEVDLFAPLKAKPSQEVVAVAGDADVAASSHSYDEDDDEENTCECLYIILCTCCVYSVCTLFVN